MHCVHREGVPDMSLASLEETHLKPAQLFIPMASHATHPSLSLHSAYLQVLPQDWEAGEGS